MESTRVSADGNKRCIQDLVLKLWKTALERHKKFGE